MDMRINRDNLAPIGAILLAVFLPMIVVASIGGWRAALDPFRPTRSTAIGVLAIVCALLSFWLVGNLHTKWALSRRRSEFFTIGTAVGDKPDQPSEDALVEQVLAFTAERTGCHERELSLGVRLAQDIGMDGDDAVEFFEKFADRFKVDITELQKNWDKHFGPEAGLAPSGSLGVVVSFFMGACTIGWILSKYVPALALWAWITVVMIFGVEVVFVYQWWFGKEDPCLPITIRDLVEAARTGCWISKQD